MGVCSQKDKLKPTHPSRPIDGSLVYSFVAFGHLPLASCVESRVAESMANRAVGTGHGTGFRHANCSNLSGGLNLYTRRKLVEIVFVYEALINIPLCLIYVA